MKTIQITLSTKNINNTISELKRYKKHLTSVIKTLLEKMVQFGEDYAINSVSHVDTGETLSSIHGYRKGNKGVIVAGGNAIWLEFGTGVTYNGSAGSSPHPKGEALGMTIGTYGKGKGANTNGWYYVGDDGKVTHTYGIQANMFMYRTAKALIEELPDMAKELFNG